VPKIKKKGKLPLLQTSEAEKAFSFRGLIRPNPWPETLPLNPAVDKTLRPAL